MTREERCINCCQPFNSVDDYDDRVFTIDLISATPSSSSAFHDVVTVETVLSSIFSFNRINQFKSFIPMNQKQQNFGIHEDHNDDSDEKINPAFCKRCALVVSKLYNFYLELQQYAHPDSYMTRRTKELDSMMGKLEDMVGSSQYREGDPLATTTFAETRLSSSSMSPTFSRGPWVHLKRVTEEEITAAGVRNVKVLSYNKSDYKRKVVSNFQEEEIHDQMDIALGSVEVFYDVDDDYDPQESPYYDESSEPVMPTAYMASTSDEDTKRSLNLTARRTRTVRLKKKTIKKKNTISKEKSKSSKPKMSSQQRIKRSRNIKRKNVKKIKTSSPAAATAATTTSEKIKSESSIGADSSDVVHHDEIVNIIDTQLVPAGVGRVRKCLACPICKKVYKKKYLRKHLKTHEPTASRPQFQCPICPKSLFSSSSLSIHIKAHEAGRCYVCNFCSMAFNQAGNLRGHIKSVHLQDKPFLCPLCGKAFAKSYGLKRHMNTHSEEKNLKCGIGDCDKFFNDIERLKKHQQVHMGELNQSLCSFCGKSYSNSALKKHIRTHTGERPKKCPYLDCGLSFIDSRSLKRHIRRRHNNNNNDNNDYDTMYKDADSNECVQIEVSTDF